MKAYIQGSDPGAGGQDATNKEEMLVGGEDIEREDREAEERKKNTKGGCVCF